MKNRFIVSHIKLWVIIYWMIFAVVCFYLYQNSFFHNIIELNSYYSIYIWIGILLILGIPIFIFVGHVRIEKDYIVLENRGSEETIQKSNIKKIWIKTSYREGNSYWLIIYLDRFAGELDRRNPDYRINIIRKRDANKINLLLKEFSYIEN